MNESFDRPPEQASPPSKSVPVPTFDSRDLMKGGREIYIHHKGELYRLQETRNGKLILKK
jgi:hemin uptake protein HemP